MGAALMVSSAAPTSRPTRPRSIGSLSSPWMSTFMASLRGRRRLAAAHGQHGAPGPRHHARCDAAEKEPNEARASVRPDHDEVGLPAARRAEDLIVGHSLYEERGRAGPRLAALTCSAASRFSAYFRAEASRSS